MKNKIKSYDVVIITILIISGILLCNKSIGADSFYIIKAGENTLKYGLYTNDLLLMHKGLNYINQHWLTSIIYYGLSKLFGLKLGMMVNTIIVSSIYLVVMYILNRKLCKDNYKMAIAISFIEIFPLMYFNCLYNRPQVFSVVLLILFIINLENYKETDNKKYLIYNITLSIIEINLHMSIWWILIIALLPYIFNFKLKANKIEISIKENIKYLIFSIIILITGLLNPYGFKGMTYIFRCGIDKWTKEYCEEYWSIFKQTSSEQYLYIIVLTAVLVGIIYYIYKNKELEMKYIYFGIGGLLMSIIAIRNMCFTLVFSCICLCYLLRNIKIEVNQKKFVNIASIVLLIVIGFEYNNDMNTCKFNSTNQHIFDNTINMLDNYCQENNIDKENLRLYTHKALGSYIEYNGYHPFDDCRNEALRKEMNGVQDYFIDSIEFSYGLKDCSYLLETYNIQAIYLTEEAIERVKSTNEEYFNNNWKLYDTQGNTSVQIVLYVRK